MFPTGKINQKAVGKQAHGHSPLKSTSQNREQGGQGWREMGSGVGLGWGKGITSNMNLPGVANYENPGQEAKIPIQNTSPMDFLLEGKLSWK